MKDKSIYEADLCAQLGITREAVVKLRKDIPLKKGQHWRYGASKRIYIKPAGLELLLAALAQKSPKSAPPPESPQNAPESSEGMNQCDGAEVEPSASPEQNAAEESAKSDKECPPPVIREVIKVRAEVVKVPKNPKILECRSKEVDGPLLVRVQNNAKWVPGMKLTVRKAVEMPTLWLLEGRSPRRKGKM